MPETCGSPAISNLLRISQGVMWFLGLQIPSKADSLSATYLLPPPRRLRSGHAPAEGLQSAQHSSHDPYALYSELPICHSCTRQGSSPHVLGQPSAKACARACK